MLMGIIKYFRNLYRYCTNFISLKEKCMDTEYKIILPRGNYTVELESVSTFRYMDGTAGDVTLTFNFKDVPDRIIEDFACNCKIVTGGKNDR